MQKINLPDASPFSAPLCRYLMGQIPRHINVQLKITFSDIKCRLQLVENPDIVFIMEEREVGKVC